MRNITKKIITLPLLALSLALVPLAPAYADGFNGNRIIDDAPFDNADSMSPSLIDAWLNQFPNSCISPNSGFSAIQPVGYNPTSGYQYGDYVSAGQVIYDAGQVYGLNPQVLLATLQKEQSLVVGSPGYCNNGDQHKYAAAVGYGCPDSGTTYSYSGLSLYRRNGVVVSSTGTTCVNSASKAGFSQQVIRAAWLLKFGEQRSKGNINWAVIKGNWDNSDDPQTCYAGPMTQGTFQRCPSGGAAYYDGFTTIDGVATHMDSGATAALYWYTPHLHGNQNFYSTFVSWFGDPNSSCVATSNVSGAIAGNKVVPFRLSDNGPMSLAFTQQNNTGSACAEAHVWAPGLQTWASHIATGMRASNPALGTFVSTNQGRNSKSGLTYVLYSGGNGAVEIHKLSPNLQKFPGYYDVATNLAGVTPTSGTFVSGDFFGRGSDQLAYVLYSNGTGHTEIHMFDPSLQKAVGYYDVATNLSNVTATSGSFVAGDFLGIGRDQLAYVIYAGNNGNAEVHLFDASLQKAVGYYDVPTNLAGTSAATGTFAAGDFLGRGYDQLQYISYSGSTSRVETHLFNRDLTQGVGFQDISTNLPPFDPNL